MKFGRWAAHAAVAGMAVTLLAACGSAPSTGSSGGVSAPLQQKNEFVDALTSSAAVTDWAPILSASTYSVYNSQSDYMMWAPVVMVSGSDTIDWADSVAKHISASPDGSTYTVTLNNWKFSDGSPITAQDVAWDATFMIQDCQDSSSAFPYGGCGFVLPPSGGPGSPAYLVSATAQGANTVVFKLSGPANPTWFELNGLGQIMVFPKSVWDKGSVGATATFMKQVSSNPSASAYNVVSGPYKFSKHVANEYDEWVPNPTYGGHKASVNWVQYYTASDAAEYAAIKTGKVNVATLPPSLFPDVNTIKAAGYNVASNPPGFCWFGLMLNSAPNAKDVGKAFQDPAVRAALQYGIDENAIGKTLYGTFNGQNQWIDMYSAVPPVPASLSKALFGTTNVPGPYQYNPAKGMKLLEQDGWKENANGIMQKGNTQLSFPLVYGSGSVEQADAAVILQQDWEKEGIYVTLAAEPFNVQITDTDSTPQAASQWAANWYGGWCYEPNFYPDGYGMWNYYNTVDDFNLATQGWNDLQKAMAATYKPGTPAQNQASMLNYAEATAKDLPMLWMPTAYAPVATASYIHGLAQARNPVQDWVQVNYITISK